MKRRNNQFCEGQGESEGPAGQPGRDTGTASWLIPSLGSDSSPLGASLAALWDPVQSLQQLGSFQKTTAQL